MTETSLGKSRRCSEAVQPLWPRARPGKRLRANEIHIWSACLTRPEGVRVPFLETLSAEERERAARFHFHQDQRRWIICRGVLRTLLGSYLDLEPARIRFREGEYGKPQLQSAPPLALPSPPSVSPPDPGGRYRGGGEGRVRGDLRFNVSHSEKLALFAFLNGREVGVDLEFLRPMPDGDAVSERFFSSWERAAFREMPEAQKTEAFFRCWTRKEAFIKAIGQGLSHPLDRFDVSLAPGESARLLAIDGDSEAANRWLLRELSPAPGYLGALAVDGRGWELICWHYQDDAEC